MQIKNRKTKETREVTQEGWDAIDKNSLMKDWYIVAKTKTPPEVAALEAKKDTAKVEADKKTTTTTNGK